MSEMTAMRIGRWATVVVLCVGWLVAAYFLWRTSVPHLDTGGLDARRYFSAALTHRAARYQTVLDLLWLGHVLAEIAALAVLAWRIPRIARTLGLGPIGAGVIVAMVMLVTLWFVALPFGFVEQWWAAHNGLAPHDYVSWIFAPWTTLGVEAVFALVTVAIVMSLARRLGERWYFAAVPVFAAIALLFAFVSGYAVTLGTHPVRDARLRAAIATLERREHVGGTRVRIQDVSRYTDEANAFSTGFGPSTRVVVWNTMLDGRFSPGEVRVVIAHELGHVERKHVLKAVGWSALLALPLAWLVTLATRRRGGLGNPASLPLALLALVVLQLVAAPVQNAVSRRYEAEADWTALRATHDTRSMTRLFESFARTSLQEPNPSLLDYLWLEDHPTLAQRVQMAQRFRAIARASRGGS
jgi:Zn-dependent protease with chaperone function